MIDERGARPEAPHLAAKPGSADDQLNVRALSYSNPPVERRDEVEAAIAHARIRQLRDFSRT